MDYEPLVHISSKGERSKTALFVHSLGKFSHHYISSVCIAPFIPHKPWRIFCAFWQTKEVLLE